MKTLKSLSLAVFVLMGALAFGQTSLTQTTLAADQGIGPASLAGGSQANLSTVISLNSATGVVQAFNGAPVTWAYVDGELEGILTSVPGSTTIFNVQRPAQGTKAAYHKANAVVYIQVGSPQFGGFSGSGGLFLSDPPFQGNCLGGSTLLSPWINVITSEQWVCQQFPTPSGALIMGWTPTSLWLYPSQNYSVELYLDSAYSNATTVMSNVAGATANTGNLGFFAQANRAYHASCHIVWQNGTSGDAIQYQWTGPSSPTAVLFSAITTTTLGVTATSGLSSNKTVTSFSAANATGLTTVTASTNFSDDLELDVVNGVNAGTIQLQAAAVTGGTITIAAGSSCKVQ